MSDFCFAWILAFRAAAAHLIKTIVSKDAFTQVGFDMSNERKKRKKRMATKKRMNMKKGGKN